MHRLTIRDMQEDDIPSVMEIERISFSSPWSEIFFLNEIYKKYGISKVAVFEGKVVGYVSAEYRLHEAYLLNLAAHPGFRRQGVATALMDEELRELKEKGCVFVYLKVRVSNKDAQKFYELFGFKVEGIRKKYYNNPDEDALVMAARL